MLVHEIRPSIWQDESILMTIREEMISKLGGSMLLTLIEIASTSPDQTNPTKLCQSLEVPLSTLSTHIKKLINLDYIESCTSLRILQDSRCRNYKVTPKGILLLNLLREVLDSSLNQLNNQTVFDEIRTPAVIDYNQT